MHFLCIVYGEYIDGGHLEKPRGVTRCQFTLSGPVDQPEVEKTIARTIKQLDAVQRKGYSSHYSCIKPSLLLNTNKVCIWACSQIMSNHARLI